MISTRLEPGKRNYGKFGKLGIVLFGRIFTKIGLGICLLYELHCNVGGHALGGKNAANEPKMRLLTVNGVIFLQNALRSPQNMMNDAESIFLFSNFLS